ncbi:MAG: PDZ domain-containing protein [Planctomycetes bacterium]|nr:PDZ domain-containing protein [Planctomycetota bacterium]
MKLTWLLSLIVGGLLIFSASTNDAGRHKAEQPAPEPQSAKTFDPAMPELPDVPEFSHEQLDSSPLGILLDVNRGGSIDPMQARGTLPTGWKPDPPLNLSGPMPSDEEVRGAIVKAVNYVLDQQNENGSWDVVLSGTLMSETADQAVDAIAATGLAGYAMRRHIKVDPERIGPACKRAAQFVIDRVYRGKLPLNVWYANWRYTLGLKFLHQEYMNTEDEDFRNELRAVCRRMVQGLLRLQLSNSEAPMLERKRRKRISSRFKNTAMPSSLGVVLTPPTDEDYRGGAKIMRILPGSVAEQHGLKVGDRIVEAEGLRVENALDYYMQEVEWLGGQKVSISVRREGAKDFKKDYQLAQVWPGYLGLKLNPGIGEGPVVEGFMPFSPCKGELEIGDVIYEVDGNEITKIEEFRAVENKIEPGDKIRLKVLRGEKARKKSASIEAAGAPEGWFYFGIKEEDKGDGNGVVVDGDPRPDSPAGLAGLKDGDRVTWIGDTPILGLDHLYDFAGTVAAGKPYLVKWVRDGAEMEAEMVARPIPQPFDLALRITINNRFQAFVREVVKGGAGDKAGFKNGDVFNAINGTPTPSVFEWQDAWFDLTAGEEATFLMQRGGKEVEIKLELPKAVFTENGDETEEGGWAYYPEMGESPTFSTAAAMLALMDVEHDMDIKGLGRVLKDPLKSAASLINTMRIEDKQNGGLESYVYRGGSKDMGQIGMDVKGCQGRNAICELALVRMGMFRRSKSTLKKIIDQWTKYRGELDAVRRMEYYNPPGKGGSPHNFDRNFNAAYYWLFGHYHTLLAAKECGGKTFETINEICTKAIMLTRHDDGTWLGHPSFGPLCGTCLGLWILGETEGGWRDGYGDPLTQQKKDGEKANPETPEK